MKKMFAVVFGAMLMLGIGFSAHSAVPLEVDQAEVLRLGDVVQHVDGIRSDGREGFVEAMGPPASDADKWHISVLTMQGCGACQQLKQDWGRSEWLLALANPADPKTSWAHYNVYLREDRSQAFRFENLRVTAYPTVVVQPPRSGRYGDPSTVVFQGTYGGDPERLAREITKSIRLYLEKLENTLPRRGIAAGQVGIDPPWQPYPKDDPYGPAVNPIFPNVRPLVPPILEERPRLFEIPWGSILTALAAGVSLPVVIAVVIWLIYFIREQRKKAGQPLLLDDETLAKLVDLLKQVAESQSKNVRSTRSSKSK